MDPFTLPFQLPVVPDQPQISANETKPNPNVALTLILTLTLTPLTLLSPRCMLDAVGRESNVDRAVLNCFFPTTQNYSDTR